jgi:DNA-binding transcriptional LysR family regulator
MELTPRASALREPLAEALHRVQSLLVADSFEPRSSSRRFSLMMQDHVAHLVVPALVERVHREGPSVRLHLLPWQSPASLKPERLRFVDLLLSCSTSEIPGFQRETFFTDTEVVVVRKRHPAASRGQDLKAFLHSRHVAVVGRGLNEDPVDTWLRQEGLTRDIVLRVPNYLQALQAVAQADLVAFVPRRLAESLAGPLSLALLPPPIDPGEYQEFLFYPRRAVRDGASIWLRTLALEIGGRLASPNRLASTA